MIAEPGVAGLTFTDRLPGTGHPRWWVEVEGEEAPATSAYGHPVSSAAVAPNFFDVVGAPILAGRAFTDADVGPASGAVIVNQSFVNDVLDGKNPVGRRIRIVRVPDEPRAPGPWLEIVGVVRDLGTQPEPSATLSSQSRPIRRLFSESRSGFEVIPNRSRRVSGSSPARWSPHCRFTTSCRWTTRSRAGGSSFNTCRA